LKNVFRFCHIAPELGRRHRLPGCRATLSGDLPLPGRTVSTDGHYTGPPIRPIFLDDGLRSPSSKHGKESSMTRSIGSHRYEIEHGDDADFVTYQRKSSDGVWQTISMWMIPEPADH
jgi:hypothetical protein